ncbi:MAG: GspE/PulE family protein [Puniceicoccales bacterium]|nr:GspE/PulE family protein [Puniceicoccales bacterium]
MATAGSGDWDLALPCHSYRLVPVRKGLRGKAFYVEEGQDLYAIGHELQFLWGLAAEFVPIPQEQFAELWEDFCRRLPKIGVLGNFSDVFAATALEPSPVGRLLARIFAKAVHLGASDLHFESLRDGLLVRLRVDGALREELRLAGEMCVPISILLKTLAKLDIAERFRPQDGRFGLRFAGAAVDFRISILPTKFGESMALRILDRRRLFRGLGDLAMDAATATAIRAALASPSGLFLVTGPTGSGKTTTLYAALSEMDCPDKKVLTIEDPIEYDLQNCLQAAVDLSVGRTFSTVLRSFLRHDPDKIFVGEIRDGETAEIALRAALTGHLVLTTLHTATPREALLRLEEMGLERPLLLSCLRGILSQRLLRLNCPDCRGPENSELPPQLARLRRENLRRGIGCDSCGGRGTVGRRAFFEFLSVNEKSFQEDGAGIGSLVRAGMGALSAGEVPLEEFLQQMPWNR